MPLNNKFPPQDSVAHCRLPHARYNENARRLRIMRQCLEGSDAEKCLAEFESVLASNVV